MATYLISTARFLGTISCMGIAVLALAGCPPALQVEGAGGQGGEGAGTSISTGMGGQVGSGSTVTGAGGQGTGGQGGQGGGCVCGQGGCTCVPAAPPGWNGPVAVFVGDGAQVPGCGPEWATETDWMTGTLSAPPAQCSACTCSSPAGGSCSLTQVGIGLHPNSSCNPFAMVTPVTLPNQCIPVNVSGLPAMFSAMLQGQSLPFGGTCSATGGTASIAPAFFDKHARICADPPPAACMGGEVCVPSPTAPFHPSLCIYAPADPADPACPPGYNPLSLFYADILDSRGCSNCTCGVPYAQSCEMTASLYNDAACISLLLNLVPGDCGLISNPGGMIGAGVSPGTPTGGMCAPSASNPIGNAAGDGRIRVCCLP